jgi:two-component system CheB/CheR fusion protein
VSTLPADFPAPLVIAQHLDPRQPSHLQEILAHRTSLPVRTVLDHETLEPGVIFVVPANRHVEVTDHQVAVHAEGPGRSKPSVNLLFDSAAQAFGEGLLAVVLTGADADGAAGAHSVKEAGGTVIIQDPQTAQFPSMPASLAPTTVDIMAPLDRIGPLLHELVTGLYLPEASEQDGALRTFLAQVRERSGIDFAHYKMPTIRRLLQRRMAAVGAEHLADYQRYVQRHPDKYQRLVNSFLIKVTEFLLKPRQAVWCAILTVIEERYRFL